MPEKFKHQILRFLKNRNYTPLKLGPLAKALGVPEDDYEQFKLAFDELRQAERVVIGSKNLVSLPPMSGKITGTFRANAKGFGFVTPLEANAHGDLFIRPGATMEAMTGDTVMARVMERGKRDGQMRYAGEIIQILERGRNQFVGTLQYQNGFWFIKPDGAGATEHINVDDVTAKNAAVNDKVVVEILTYATERNLARGVIIEVLGKAGRYDAEIKSIIRQHHLPTEHDAACLEQARNAAAAFNPEILNNRNDITNQIVITIDPPDAKDFDDAISLVKNTDGNWLLGVHIADVSSFIPMNSPLDIEAKDRGNSAYLPGKTIPMLPEILSNGICSLQPAQKRFVKSAYITYDRQGNVVSRDFANSVICSFERLTYEQADAILKGRVASVKPETLALLKDMETLAQVIERRRYKHGMLHLALPETEIIMDKQGKVVDAKPADASYPHTIIEMFMVEANEAVASLLDKFNVPFLRRIHPDPDVLSTKNLSRFVSLCGIKVPRHLDRKAIQNLLEAVKNTPAEFAINMHVLRSLSKAEYSPLNIGHYALASQHYAHFTSPIRRYADLTIHRLLECYLRQQLNKGGIEEILHEQELIEIGKHITFTEQRSEDAEKELKTVLILQMLSERIGEHLDCVVTGLTNFGIFVQSQRFGIEGLIPLENLGPDSWRYDDNIHSVVGERSGVKVRLGEPMAVQIVSVNIPARQLNVVPAEPLAKGRQTDKKSKFASARAGRRKNQPRKNSPSTTSTRRKKDRRKR